VNDRDPALHDELGLLLFKRRRYNEAIASFRSALALDSDVASYHEHLGQALLDDGQSTDAIASLHRALSIDPSNFYSLLLLAHMAFTGGRRAEAIHYFQRAVEVDPSSYQAHLRYSNALLEYGDAAGASDHARCAVKLQPANFLAYEFLGEVLQREGKFTEAVAAYEQALFLNKTPRASTFQGLVAAKKITAADRSIVDQMLALADAAGLSKRDELILQASLGKALDDIGDYGPAFDHLQIARKCAKQLYRGKPFDRGAIIHTTETCRRHFTRDILARCSYGVQSDLPILIVGMPRSGTTLLEQIVSSHPQVGAAGELNFWFDSALARDVGKSFEAGYANDLAVKYRMLLRSMAPGKKRVTDKMPLNFSLLGPIHMLFPNARILHCRRHPVDTCLSLLMNTLSLPEPPLCLLEPADTVFAYKEYLRLMEHWREVLPADRFLEVDYEDVVSDKDAMTRKIIAFCGLEWDSACLHHELNERTVDTPSKWQVRQPIFSSSVARWKKYVPWLGPLRELL